ncbi:hypothetical protein [Paraburkholderia aspalathi]|uniref:hypothetical protein n=1 Tax=Paraburkholderia aspalathi TaxID=1324617 RepID=UPI0038BDAA26
MLIQTTVMDESGREATLWALTRVDHQIIGARADQISREFAPFSSESIETGLCKAALSTIHLAKGGCIGAQIDHVAHELAAFAWLRESVFGLAPENGLSRLTLEFNIADDGALFYQWSL